MDKPIDLAKVNQIGIRCKPIFYCRASCRKGLVSDSLIGMFGTGIPC